MLLVFWQLSRSYLEKNLLKRRKILWKNCYHCFVSMSCISQSEEKPCALRDTRRQSCLVTICQFPSHFRLSSETFEQLVQHLRNCPEVPTGPQCRGGEPISVGKLLLITLWLLGNQESITSVSDRFNVTKSSVFTCVNGVCRAAKNNITSQVLAWPTQERAEVIMDSLRMHRGLPSVVGAIDGCHVPIKALEKCSENYINRKTSTQLT